MGYKLTGAYIGNQKVRPSGGGGWTPSNTCVAYYKLEDDFNDYSGNGYNLTNSGIVLGTTSDGYKAGQLGVNKYAYTTAFDFRLTNSTPRTIAFWEGCSSITAGSWSMASIMKPYTSGQNLCLGVVTYVYSTLWGMGDPRCQDSGWWTATTQPRDFNMSLVDANQMHSYVFAVDGSGASWYKDGVLVGSAASAYSGTDTGFVIGNNKSTAPSRNLDGYIRQVVIDASKRTAQDVLDYHNGTA